MNSHPLIASALLAASLASGAAQAALIDRGGGLLYDDVLNITWLQDANYARTSGYVIPGGRDVAAAGGRMNWDEAVAWAASLSYAGLTGWRLPAVGPVNGLSFNYGLSFDGSTDVGHNITSPQSELAYMYHVNLGLKSGVSPTIAFQPDSGVHRNGTIGGQADVGPIKNLQSLVYWSGSESARSRFNAWALTTSDGYQFAGTKGNEHYAWAVRFGDVGAAQTPVNGVPEPATLALLGLGLAGLALARRRR